MSEGSRFSKLQERLAKERTDHEVKRAKHGAEIARIDVASAGLRSIEAMDELHVARVNRFVRNLNRSSVEEK